jgi:hypothetical protein
MSRTRELLSVSARLFTVSFMTACWDPSRDVGSDAGMDPCTVDALLANRRSDAGPVACGELMAQATSAELEAARQCVLAAHGGGLPFLVRLHPAGLDSMLEEAFLSADGTKVEHILFDSNPMGGPDGGASIGILTCGSLQESTFCTPKIDDLCLDCVGPFTQYCEHGKLR